MKKGWDVLTGGVADSSFSLCGLFPIVLMFCQHGTNLILSRGPHHSVLLGTDITAACSYGAGHLRELLGWIPKECVHPC